jgi:hypothetical protein
MLNVVRFFARPAGSRGASAKPPIIPVAADEEQAVTSSAQHRRRQRQSRTEPPIAPFVVPPTMNRRFVMLRGGLLWLIGIPLPIILILFFLGYLS